MYDDILRRLGLLNAEQLAGARAAFLRESPSEGALVAALAGALPLAVDEEVIIIASGDGADEDAVAEAALFAGRAVAPPSVLYTARERASAFACIPSQARPRATDRRSIHQLRLSLLSTARPPVEVTDAGSILLESVRHS